MSEKELDEFYETALEVAKQAGQMIRNAFDKEKHVDTKMNAADLVTETDQAVETLVHSLIKAKFPNHKFIGEETTASTGRKCEFTDDPTWIIDPVDGTTNFVHSIPEVSFSLAVTVNKKVVIGIVYVPVKEELFTARLGQGAFLNGRKLSANKITDLGKAVVIMEGGSSRDPQVVNDKVKNIQSMITRSHGVRAYGSAALNLSHVAAGRGDAYVEYGIHIWDFLAGALIASEAGAVVLDPTGSELDYLHCRILCACTLDLAKQISASLVHLDMGYD
ncbi:inositol monophosphatase 2-like [Physella acuta]|uniref:inositol monophosphatase 2-like n=1 Tax=Physella acuta TaxID=109671 RepID=UPI0027DB9BB7|nr:inositol monophosphatase 2-like [Physella acuta]